MVLRTKESNASLTPSPTANDKRTKVTKSDIAHAKAIARLFRLLFVTAESIQTERLSSPIGDPNRRGRSPLREQVGDLFRRRRLRSRSAIQNANQRHSIYSKTRPRY